MSGFTTWRIWLCAGIFFGAVGFVSWFIMTHGGAPESQFPLGLKRLSRTVAEGLVYRAPKERFPRVTCSSCRIRKLKLGLVSIGAFNVVEFDDLVVNLPKDMSVSDDPPQGEPGGRRNEGVGADAMVRSLRLEQFIPKSNYAGSMRFAGIKIRHFECNRMTSNGLELIFRAGSAENKGRRIMMRDVEIRREDNVERVKSAELFLRPKWRIVWKNGTLEIENNRVP